MADNFVANAGSGGSTFAADDIGPGVLHPRVKVEWGADGTVNDTAVAAPMPVSTSIESNQMTIGGVVVTPKYSAIALSATGNTTQIAAVTSKKIRVLAASFIANGAVNIKFQTGTGGTDLTGLYYLVANAGAVLPFNPAGWFETGSGVLLNANLSAAIAIGGTITYIEV